MTLRADSDVSELIGELFPTLDRPGPGGSRGRGVGAGRPGEIVVLKPPGAPAADGYEGAPDYPGAPAAVLDAMTYGIVVLDAQGRVVVFNAAAQASAAAGLFRLGRVGTEFRLPSKGETRRLGGLVAAAASSGAGGAMMATGRDGLMSLALLVSRLPGRLAPPHFLGGIGPDSLVLVVARDLAISVTLDPRALRSLFGLTHIESKIALAIGTGRSVEAIAEERARSVPTIRSQVRQILQKTGAESTRHLIAMLGRLHAPN